MSTAEETNEIIQVLNILLHEEELIIKPFHTGTSDGTGAIESGKIVSRVNKPLFDYKIGDKTVPSVFNSVFSQRIILTNPETKQVVLEFYRNCLPLFCRACCKQEVCCLVSSSNNRRSIGSIRQGVAFAKVWYDIYSDRREHLASVVLRKSHLKSKIQHRVPEFEIIDNDETTNIGRMYPFSTDLERSEYGKAVAVKLPQTMKVETKAVLLMATLILKERLV